MCEIQRPVVFSPVSGVRGATPGHTDRPEGPWPHCNITVINVKTSMRNTSHEKDEEGAGDDVDGEGGDGEGDGCPAHHQHESSSLAQGWPPSNDISSWNKYLFIYL